MAPIRTVLCIAILVGGPPALAAEKQRTQRFDADPGWDARNNRSTALDKRTVRQDFGYSKTNHAGGQPGEVGGFVNPAAEPAYYAKKLPQKTFAEPFAASGRIACTGREFHVQLAFFNADTINEWRTPNTVTLRLLGRGDRFYAYPGYVTAKWRAGEDSPGGFPVNRDPATGRTAPRGFKTGEPLRWSLRYDPNGNNGGGTVTATLGDATAVCRLDPGHKADGAAFTHFGILPVFKSFDGGGEIWLDDVTVDGEADDFTRDPGWDAVGNRRSYETADVRPRFDFGYSPTHHAGGRAPGELGGLVFRGDCRYPTHLAAYGDRLATLTLEKPLKASGRVALHRAVSDSTTLLGFYHSEDSLAVTPSQSSGWPRCFLGVAVEGPSREGFFFYPAYRLKNGESASADGPNRPYIHPDGRPHDWSLVYDPSANSTRGRIVVTLDDKTVSLDLPPGHRPAGARFDRFGLVTTWIDGNGQRVFFDDLTYTWGQ